VVAEVTPFTLLTSWKEFVEVEMVRVLLVMMEEVAITPFMFVVRMFPEED
jgi:hypothetical protein